VRAVASLPIRAVTDQLAGLDFARSGADRVVSGGRAEAGCRSTGPAPGCATGWSRYSRLRCARVRGRSSRSPSGSLTCPRRLPTRSGSLSDRVGRCPVILGSLTAFIVLTAATAMVDSTWGFIGLRLVAALGAGEVVPAHCACPDRGPVPVPAPRPGAGLAVRRDGRGIAVGAAGGALAEPVIGWRACSSPSPPPGCYSWSRSWPAGRCRAYGGPLHHPGLIRTRPWRPARRPMTGPSRTPGMP
jgi:hypothetical protein